MGGGRDEGREGGTTCAKISSAKKMAPSPLVSIMSGALARWRTCRDCSLLHEKTTSCGANKRPACVSNTNRGDVDFHGLLYCAEHMAVLIVSPSPSLSPSLPLPPPLHARLTGFGIATCAAGTGGDALAHQEEIARSERAKSPASLVAAEQQIPVPAQAAQGAPDRPACATWPRFF